MAHLLDNNMNFSMPFLYAGEDPWWLPLTVKDGIAYIKFPGDKGIDGDQLLQDPTRYFYQVSKLPMSVTIPIQNEDGSFRSVTLDDQYTLMAHNRPLQECTKQTMHQISKTVTKQYVVMQPHEIFAIINEIAKSGGWTIETVFALSQGDTFVTCCGMPSLTRELNGNPKELMKTYFGFVNPFTGQHSWQAVVSHIRMVCGNTVSQAIMNAGKSASQLIEVDGVEMEVSKSRTKSNHKRFDEKMAMLSDMIDFANNQFHNKVIVLENMMNRKFPDKDGALFSSMMTVLFEKPFIKVRDWSGIQNDILTKTVGFDPVYEFEDMTLYHLLNGVTQMGIASYDLQGTHGKQDMSMAQNDVRTNKFVDILNGLYYNGDDYADVIHKKAKVTTEIWKNNQGKTLVKV